MPVLATYFSVRRGRDPFFKFFMRTIFPRQVKEYEDRFGIRFIGWYNVAHGWDFDNVILLDLPDYATLDKLEADEATRALGHRAGEWIFERVWNGDQSDYGLNFTALPQLLRVKLATY